MADGPAPVPQSESLATTKAYVAVYDQDVIDHHRAFIARRRGLRPSLEYREPTDAEWDEFLGHFERRKVELGCAAAARARPVSTNMPAFAAPCCGPIPTSSADSRRSSRTSTLA